MNVVAIVILQQKQQQLCNLTVVFIYCAFCFAVLISDINEIQLDDQEPICIDHKETMITPVPPHNCLYYWLRLYFYLLPNKPCPVALVSLLQCADPIGGLVTEGLVFVYHALTSPLQTACRPTRASYPSLSVTHTNIILMLGKAQNCTNSQQFRCGNEPRHPIFTYHMMFKIIQPESI